MAEHKHGDMDIKDHVKTFDGFMKFTTYTVVAIIVLLVLMAVFIT
ncbi:MAG: aa3-type cytochrome c oxidase subunit IV [Rhodobacteraceae bacterium]|nr:aa3-type cytochrome c oxidase subunit IV [Paracoccaceae bacterium]